MDLKEAKLRTKILMADLKNQSDKIPRYKENFLEYREALEIIFNELENSIPKKKIEDKIKELDCKEFYQNFPDDYMGKITIQVLQELLEEK